MHEKKSRKATNYLTFVLFPRLSFIQGIKVKWRGECLSADDISDFIVFEERKKIVSARSFNYKEDYVRARIYY